MLIPLMGILSKSRINSSTPSRVLRQSPNTCSLSSVVSINLLLSKPLDHEDIIDKILDGLDDDYKTIDDIVQNRETLILFDELHKKLINWELTLKHLQSGHFSFSITTNIASGRPTNIHYSSNSRSTSGHPAQGPLASF